MHRDGCEIVLTRQHEGQLPVFHKRQTLTIGPVDGIDGLLITNFILNILGQVSHGNRADINKVGLVCIFEIERRIHGLPLLDLDCLNHGLWTQQGQIDMQQPVFHDRLSHFDTIGKHKTALKLARGDSAMQEYAVGTVVMLPTSDHKLSVLNGYAEILFPKSCHRQCDPIGSVGRLFDIERRIPIVAGLRRPFQQAFKLLEPKQMGIEPKVSFVIDTSFA